MIIQNCFTRCVMALLISLAFLSSSREGVAQSPDQSESDNSTKSKAEIIVCPTYVTMVRVKVRDKTGKEVSDLTKDDFIVYEDGVRQPIVLWTSEDGDSDAEGIQPGYEMAYYPMKYPFDGKFRRIQVVVRPKRKDKLRVEFSPKGYYAKKELLK